MHAFRLQHQNALDKISHVVVDEAHERDINTDFLLAVIRDLLPKVQPLSPPHRHTTTATHSTRTTTTTTTTTSSTTTTTATAAAATHLTRTPTYLSLR